MIEKFVRAWEKNKGALEAYFETTPQSEYDSYGKIWCKVLEIVVNPYYRHNDYDDNFYLAEKTVRVDFGDYCGTLIFITPTRSYEPDIYEHVITYIYYGSCSCCDTLLGISDYESGLPSDEQTKDYMTLALHMIQNAFIPGESEIPKWLK